MSEWISVEDRLPAPDQVLVRHIKPRLGVPSAFYTTAYFEDGEGWMYWDGDKPISHPVTHWMPLPAPPTE